MNPWTVNNEADIRGCLETGADILIGNYHDRSLRLLKEWEAVK